MDTITATRRSTIEASDREIAVAMLKAMAENTKHFRRLSSQYMYEEDSDTAERIIELLGNKVPARISWRDIHRRLIRVYNCLIDYGIVAGWSYSKIDRQYTGKDLRQKEFIWANNEYAFRIRPDIYPHYTPRSGSTPDRELEWLLRHAYPREGLSEIAYEENDSVVAAF